MNRTLALVLAALCAASAHGALAGRGAAARQEPDEAERALVNGSRAAVIAAGLSPRFFDAHFRLEEVSNRPADRRVVWRLKVGEHEALVSDPVGSYTDERGVRRDAHAVSSLITPARDLRATITRRRAERLMRACIGEFRNGAVVYQLFGAPPRAALVFTAVEAVAPRPAAAPAASPPQTEIRQGGRKRPPPRIGMLDLETGRCLVGVGQSGSPHPDADEIIRRRP